MPSGKLCGMLRLGAVSALVVACADTGGVRDGDGFRADYLRAREALESGDYAAANRHYEALLQARSPVAARLELEYAHGLLRAERFADAIVQADALIDSQTGPVRASALAVRGTARHETATSLRAEGADSARITPLLQGARDDISAFLSAHPDLDAGGSMRERAGMIAADLGAP